MKNQNEVSRPLLAAISILCLFLVAQIFYSLTHPKIVFSEVEVIKEVTKDSTVMERIADCESGKINKNTGLAIKGTATHIDPETGQVYTKANTNGSVDIGKYMVNEYYHGKEATKLGYDLTKEKDNKAFAYWLYDRYGTEPWKASINCWR